MRAEDDVEDSRVLLSGRLKNETADKRTCDRPWELWGIAFICLLVGVALGALLSTTRARNATTCKLEQNKPSVPAAPFGIVSNYTVVVGLLISEKILSSQ
jgi:hypothetical protein